MQLLILALTLFGLSPTLDQVPPIEVPADATCVLDANEPNDTRRRARVFEGVAEGRLCAEDVDWLAFEGVRGRRYQLTFEGTGDARIYAPRARKARRVRPHGTFRARRTGRYKIRIVGPHGGAYRLQVEAVR